MSNPSLTITPSALTLKIGESAQLSAVPSAGVQFYGSVPTIASVTPGGLVTGVGAGNTTVFARKGNKSVSVPVRVVALVNITTGSGRLVAPVPGGGGTGLIGSFR